MLWSVRYPRALEFTLLYSVTNKPDTENVLLAVYIDQADFKDSRIELIGISSDSVDQLKSFADKQKVTVRSSLTVLYPSKLTWGRSRSTTSSATRTRLCIKLTTFRRDLWDLSMLVLLTLSTLREPFGALVALSFPTVTPSSPSRSYFSDVR